MGTGWRRLPLPVRRLAVRSQPCSGRSRGIASPPVRCLRQRSTSASQRQRAEGGGVRKALVLGIAVPMAAGMCSSCVAGSEQPGQGSVSDLSGIQKEPEESVAESAVCSEPADGLTCEAVSAYTKWQLACLYACGAAAGVGCVAASGMCATGTVVTVGCVAIPCVVVIAAACGAVGGAGAGCGAYCVG